MMNPNEEVARLYSDFGQRKPMGKGAPQPNRPHYFLLRQFLSDLDLLLILNTKRCRYQCLFCNLPDKSLLSDIPGHDIVEQVLYVCREVKHALSILSRLTLSNEGSVLDTDTLPSDALLAIVRLASEIRSLRRIVLETRLEFVAASQIAELREMAPSVTFDILTGLETRDDQIRQKILGKGDSIKQFESGLDQVAEAGADLTSYVLFKPDPAMADQDAIEEATSTIQYLEEQTRSRGIKLRIRLNPMYAAKGTPWATAARQGGDYVPPRLSDVLKVARESWERGTETYIGLSSEGLAETEGTYLARGDFSRAVLREAKKLNRRSLL